MSVLKCRAWLIEQKEMRPVEKIVLGESGEPLAPYVVVEGWCEMFTLGDEAVLVQRTGLKDTNGEEIYEGDIVKGQITLGYKRTGVIKFDTDAFCFVEFWKEGMLTMFEENPDRMTIYNGFGGLEIVGSIYENPELLG